MCNSNKVCFICGKEIVELGHGCLDSAGSVEFSFGYGSKFDMSTFKGYVHDDCLDNHFNMNLLEKHFESM